MLKLWRLIRQDDYIEFLKLEIQRLSEERDNLRDTLFKVLKLHLIPKDRTELIISEQSQIPVQNKVRNVRSVLSDLQKKSYDEAVRRDIEAEEKRINELENKSNEVGTK